MEIRNVGRGWISELCRRLQRSNKTPFREQGRAAAAERRWPEAIAAYERHLGLRPRDGQTWLRLANLLKDSGCSAEAEAAYIKACDVMPRAPDAWLNRGHLAKLEGRMSDALSHYRRSFTLNGSAAAGREIQMLGGEAVSAGPASDIVGTIDNMVGRTISGWAVDPGNLGSPAKVEFFQAGQRIAEARADLSRVDVLAAGFGTSIAGFRVKLGAAYKSGAGPITVRLASSGRALCNSPYWPEAVDSVGRWLERWNDVEVESVRTRFDFETAGHLLSIIMPVYNPPAEWLSEAIDSVIAQYCSRWELICVDDASGDSDVMMLLNEYAAKDSRIKIVSMPMNVGISKATNAGLGVASGDYVAFMDHDDALEPEAVYRVLGEARGGADLIYSDEVITGLDIGDVIEVVARPAFSYDDYISHPYFVHFVAVRTDLAIDIGGLDVDMSISMDVDFVLRVIERADRVAHVPVPLYRWRTHIGSAGHAKVDSVMDATRSALQRHHDRLNSRAVVTNGKTFNTFRTDYVDTSGRVLVVIPTKNRIDLLKPCVESVLSTTGREVDIVIVDHESSDPDVLDYLRVVRDRVKVMHFSGDFNFSKMNNLAVGRYGEGYDFYLFLNNDVEAPSSGWLEHMRGLCLRPDVGVVGALLLYADDRVQHGGVVMGVGGPAEHAYKGEPYALGGAVNPGYLSGLVSVRDYMAVTGACMLVRAEVFHALHGFDELLSVGFNDVDLCLRARCMDFKVLFDGHAVLYHYESATRSLSKQLAHPEDTQLMLSRWDVLLSRPDPYYSSLFGRGEPALFAVVEPIDIFARANVWERRQPGASGREPRSIGSPNVSM